jgi:uncharacterized RDD family membrane protein YckC
MTNKGMIRALVSLALAFGSLLPGTIWGQNDADTKAGQAKDQIAEVAEVATNSTDSASTDDSSKRSWRPGRIHHDALVSIGHDVVLKEDETAEAVVVIGGSAIIRGRVRDAAVAIGGNLDIEGEVGDAAVAVMGNVKAGPGAHIHGDLVTVGGKSDMETGAKVDGHVQVVDTPIGLPHAKWLKGWLVHSLFKLRPLAPQVGWVWGIWAVFLLVYLLIAAVFPRPVQACIDELTRRPATSFLMGLLSKLLLPVVLLILTVTILGIVVVPFVLAALFLGLLVGKVAILEWLGLTLGRHVGTRGITSPLGAFLLGALIVTVLYLVPVLGLVAFGVLSVWGLGCAVMAAFGGFRKEMPEKPTAPPTSAAIPPIAPMPSGTPASSGSNPAPAFLASNAVPPLQSETVASAGTPAPEAANATVPPLVPPSDPAGATAAVASLPDAWAFPKASFWERMGAAFLDVVLVSILGSFVGGPPLGFLVALAYFSGMWAWKATTIGGIVLGLKVSRLDGQPLTFVIALVRGLAAGFSVVVLFLGFLWIIWDKDKQGWHDRIAGTVVVKLPRGTPLV